MSDEPHNESPGQCDTTSSREERAATSSEESHGKADEKAAIGKKGALMAVTDSGEMNVKQLIESSFTSPESTKHAVNTLIEAYDDKGLLLAAQVQPEHLTLELRHRSADLSTLVIVQWVRQGETHKLKQLGDALLSEAPRLHTQEGARIMAVLAGLLGILRPQIARRLLETSAPHMADPSDTALLRDARRWVEAGSLLESASSEERIFWNRRLREPNAEWDWNSTEARLALSHLATRKAPDELDLELFQKALPGCWWDLWRSRTEVPTPSPHFTPPPSLARKSSKAGVMLSAAAALTFGWWSAAEFPWLQNRLGIHSQTSPAAAATNQAKSIEPSPPQLLVEEDEPAPPIRESLRRLQAVLKAEAGQDANTPSLADAATVSATASTTRADLVRAPETEPPLTVPESPFAKESARKQAAARFALQNPEIARLFRMVKEGSFRENQALLQGANSVAKAGSKEHQNLIHWLVLDPPTQADTRLVVTKMALRSLPAPEVVPLFNLCYYPGSPNEIEIKECSQLLLELSSDDMRAEEKAILQTITGVR